MARLRAPDGCAWDREQTLQTLKAYLIEETYEVLEAIDLDAAAHREELGDLLLQVVFQAQIRAEQGTFTIADVAQAIANKLVRRHPHVFGDTQADSAKEALASWERIKASEKPNGGGRLASIPKAMPALLRAYRSGEKAASVGFDWPDHVGPLAKVEEELAEVKTAIGGAPSAVREELGDLLFAITNLARHLQVDPEAALQAATTKFHRRFAHVETRLAESGAKHATLSELDRYWDEAKRAE